MRANLLMVVVIAAALLALPALTSAQAVAEVDTLELAKLTPAELFLRSASSALQFEAMREPSRKILVRNHEESIPYLVTELDTDGARERHALEDILVRIGEPAVQPLIEALGKEALREDTTRGARLAAGVLGRLGDNAAVPQLSEVHAHADWKVRGAVAGALGRIGSTEAVPTLVSMLVDGNEVVRKGAAVGLGRISAAQEEGSAYDADVAVALIRALADPVYSVRYSAANALGRMGDDVVPLLAGAVGSGRPVARLMVIRALGATGSTKALKPLSDALRSDLWNVRAFAAEAIGEIGPDRRARRALERALDDCDHPLVEGKLLTALEEDEN